MMECLCFYCKRKCRFFRPNGHARDVTPYWRCDYHGAVTVRHFYDADNKILTHHSLVAFYKEARYQAVFFHQDFHPWKFRIDKLNPHPQTIHTIITLDFHPDINPDNVTRKLPTLILFS